MLECQHCGQHTRYLGPSDSLAGRGEHIDDDKLTTAPSRIERFQIIAALALFWAFPFGIIFALHALPIARRSRGFWGLMALMALTAALALPILLATTPFFLRV